MKNKSKLTEKEIDAIIDNADPKVKANLLKDMDKKLQRKTKTTRMHSLTTN
jgi:hypothetical protein